MFTSHKNKTVFAVRDRSSDLHIAFFSCLSGGFWPEFELHTEAGVADEAVMRFHVRRSAWAMDWMLVLDALTIPLGFDIFIMWDLQG